MMMVQLKSARAIVIAMALLLPSLISMDGQVSNETPEILPVAQNIYKLGIGDSLSVQVADETRILPGPYNIELDGTLRLPELGTIHADGMTLAQLEVELTERSKALLQHPVVTVLVVEYRSQRVSVLGAVAKPGVQQIKGQKNLFEAISEAGGLRENAGGHITITRRQQWGAIPLPGARKDLSGAFSVAEISVDDLMNGRNPARNVALAPDDTVTVARSQMVYVIGAVNRAGGYDLQERDQMSSLQALALAQGLGKTALSKGAKILRSSDGGKRQEITFDMNKVMKGKAPDMALQANDILFIPNSSGKSVGLKTLDVLLATGSGVATYHVY